MVKTKKILFCVLAIMGHAQFSWPSSPLPFNKQKESHHKLKFTSYFQKQILPCSYEDRKVYVHCNIGPDFKQVKKFCLSSKDWQYPLCSRENTNLNSWQVAQDYSLYVPSSYSHQQLEFTWQLQDEENPRPELIKVPECDLICIREQAQEQVQDQVKVSKYSLPEKNKKQILFFGASTLVDNGGEFSFPLIFKYLLETQYPGVFQVQNLSQWSASFSDHIYNWQHFAKKEFQGRPLLGHIFYDGLNSQGPKGGYEFLPQDNPYPIGAKDFYPHVIIIGQMWNDLYSRIFLKKGNIPTIRGKTLPYLHQESILNYALNPNLKSEQLVKKLSIKMNKTNFQNKENHLMPWKMALEETYSSLLNAFVLEIRKSYATTPIILISLPFEINQNTPKQLVNSKLKQSLNLKYTLGQGADLEFWSQVEAAQIRSMNKFAQKNKNIYFFDMAKIYHEGINQLPIKKAWDLGIFGDDLMHLGIWGNFFIADLFYAQLINSPQTSQLWPKLSNKIWESRKNQSGLLEKVEFTKSSKNFDEKTLGAELYTNPKDSKYTVSKWNNGNLIYQTTYQTDIYGHRKTPTVKNVQEQIADKNKLIIFLGDSFTFGEGVEENETLPAQFAELTNNNLIFNFGVPGHGPGNILGQLRNSSSKIFALDSHKKIYLYGLADFQLNRIPPSFYSLTTRPEHYPVFKIQNQKLQFKGSAQSVFAKTSLILKKLNSWFPFIAGINIFQQKKIFFKILEEIKLEVEKNKKAEFVIFLFPGPQKINDELIKWGQSHSVRVLDYGNLIASLNPGTPPWFMAHDGHPTALLYQVLARKLAQDL